MWKTALFLLLTLLVLPFIAFRFDVPLTDLQQLALSKVLWIYIISASLCFIVSTLSKNYSQVDKLWSIIPIAYVWVIADVGSYEPRLVLMASLVTLWGARLTYNFGRRGGYSWRFWEGDEDYRWAILQAKPEFQASWRWLLFNFFFISFYQMGLILLFTLPILKAIQGQPLNWADGLLTILMIGFILIETIADQQQWNFQTEKWRRINTKEELPTPYKQGFISSGLWGIVRHPNYASEQAIWIVFYCFSIVATGNWLNWSVVGCLLLLLLFKGSSDFSEGISAEKYPAYKDYQKRVPRFIPNLKAKN